MKWWKRGLFSLISLITGFFSLDYLIFSYRLLAHNTEAAGYAASLPYQAAGAALFLIYAVVLAGYLLLIRKNSYVLPTRRNGDKKKNWKGPRIELLLQICILITGLLLRLGFLLYIYLPSQF